MTPPDCSTVTQAGRVVMVDRQRSRSGRYTVLVDLGEARLVTFTSPARPEFREGDRIAVASERPGSTPEGADWISRSPAALRRIVRTDDRPTLRPRSEKPRHEPIHMLVISPIPD